MAKYESVAAFSVKEGEEAAKALVEKFKELIEKNSAEDSVTVDEWGKKKLAYECGDHEREGYYAVYSFDADVAFPAELERIYNITDGILRHGTFAK